MTEPKRDAAPAAPMFDLDEIVDAIARTRRTPPTGPRWAAARRRVKLTKAELARRADCSHQSIANLETADRAVSDSLRRCVALELLLAAGLEYPPELDA